MMYHRRAKWAIDRFLRRGTKSGLHHRRGSRVAVHRVSSSLRTPSLLGRRGGVSAAAIGGCYTLFFLALFRMRRVLSTLLKAELLGSPTSYYIYIYTLLPFLIYMLKSDALLHSSLSLSHSLSRSCTRQIVATRRKTESCIDFP